MLNKINTFKISTNDELKNRLKVFLTAAVVASIIFLPFIIYDKGIFIFYGDYNSQQIPFYKLAHDAIKNKEFGISWNTDLGSNFIASYSFYLLGSPFFWLTIPFPNSFVPYLMAPLLILKIAISALTSYIFIRMFTKTNSAAYFASLTYAFSGFSIYNIFFNHFHEVIAFFPLMLIGFENLIRNKKKGIFALAVAINLIINFYFFVAEVVFLLIYFVVRCFFNKDFKITFKTFILLFFEAIVGVAMGFVLFLPSALMIIKNPRVSSCLLGFDTIFYQSVQKYGLLLSSLFFPPDMPSLPNMFPGAGGQWSSVCAYIPMFGMTGIIAFLKGEKKSWLKKLIITLLVFTAVPFLNSAFNGFNSSFYTRWFFALTLMLALITAIALEKHRENFMFAIKVNLIFIFTFAIIGLIPKKIDDDIAFFSLPNHVLMFWINFFIATAGILITKKLLYCKNNINSSNKKHIVFFYLFIVIYSITQLAWGKFYFNNNEYETIVTNGINFKFEDEDEKFHRIEVLPENGFSNLNMFLKKPSATAFQSTVNSSIMNFYINLGIKRDVSSKIPPEYENLRNFLSVKYILTAKEYSKEVEKTLPKNFKFFKEKNEYKIYKNKNFLNMGFAMHNYMTKEEFSKLENKLKDVAIVNCVIISKEQAEKYNKILNKVTKKDIEQLTKENLKNKTNNLKKESCKNFKKNSYGFSASINLEKESLVVFSVPYESGFKATVNNKKAEIEEIDSGIMAVKCEKGHNNINFSYKTPGLTISVLVSIAGMFIFLAYLIFVNKFFKHSF